MSRCLHVFRALRTVADDTTNVSGGRVSSYAEDSLPPVPATVPVVGNDI
jgi:hypothetical protein